MSSIYNVMDLTVQEKNTFDNQIIQQISMTKLTNKKHIKMFSNF